MLINIYCIAKKKKKKKRISHKRCAAAAWFHNIPDFWFPGIIIYYRKSKKQKCSAAQNKIKNKTPHCLYSHHDKGSQAEISSNVPQANKVGNVLFEWFCMYSLFLLSVKRWIHLQAHSQCSKWGCTQMQQRHTLHLLTLPPSMLVLVYYYSHRPINKWSYSAPLGEFIPFSPNMTLINLWPKGSAG